MGRPLFLRIPLVFDIGFSELMLIGLVALIVIGPERLPRVARTVGHLIGRLQRYVADVKADISREVDLDEFRKMRDSVQDAASSIETSIASGLTKTEDELKTSLSLDPRAREDKEKGDEADEVPVEGARLTEATDSGPPPDGAKVAENKQ